jgi:hypothetical protein
LEVTGENGRTDHFADHRADCVYVASMISKMIRDALLPCDPRQLYLACQDLFAGDLKLLQKAGSYGAKSSTLRSEVEEEHSL